MSKTLVAIGAHADDVELNAGGLVAKWAAEGAKVHVVMMTDNCSGLKFFPEKTASIRHREQEAAAALYGGTVHYMNYCQRHYWHEDLERRISIDFESDVPRPAYMEGHVPLLIAPGKPAEMDRLAETILGLEPDLVITQTPIDTDPEHHAVATMVWRVFQKHRDRLADVPLWYWAPCSTCQDGMIDPHWDNIVDISDHFEKKLELCACHESQMMQLRWDMVKL